MPAYVETPPAWMTWEPSGITYGYTEAPVPDMCVRPGCQTIYAACRCIHTRYGGTA